VKYCFICTLEVNIQDRSIGSVVLFIVQPNEEKFNIKQYAHLDCLKACHPQLVIPLGHEPPLGH